LAQNSPSLAGSGVIQDRAHGYYNIIITSLRT